MRFVDSSRGSGPFRLFRRIIDARRGDVRAMEDVYHLRGVLTFVLLFAATIVLPGLMLAYYGIAGIRADELASAAEMERRGTAAGGELQRRVEVYFQRFEDATNNRLKTGQSVFSGLGELSPDLRAVLCFDAEGNLISPFRQAGQSGVVQEDFSLFPAWVQAAQAERAGEFAQAAALYGVAARDAQARNAKAQAQMARARALVKAREVADAEDLLDEVIREYSEERGKHGVRLGDVARLVRAEEALKRSPDEGTRALVALVDGLLSENWTIGEGGEAAVARRALDMITEPPDATWLPRATSLVKDRSRQLYWAGRVIGELETLGARGGLLRGDPGKFSYYMTPTALWAMTWTDRDQYAFALELDAILSEVGDLADAVGGAEGEVLATLVEPDGAVREGTLARLSLSRWLPGYSVAIHPRDPAEVSRRQQEERRRGLGIIFLSVVMIVVGAALSARLVQRELDAARDKSDFAAHVSHELRSPITQIRLKAEALQLGLAPDEPSRSKHYDVIVRESERLSRLVDNVLDFAAIERGRKRYTMRPGDIGATVARAVEAAKVSMELRGMTVDLVLPDDLPVVFHDADAVAQVLHNLLSNAAKYGQEAGWVGVEVRAGDGAVEVDVSDRGIGIAPHEQRQIFEQYYRSSDPAARRRKGTGIGLTIVKYIMEAHGGRVVVTSAPGRGSTFTLYFPTSTPVAADRTGA